MRRFVTVVVPIILAAGCGLTVTGVAATPAATPDAGASETRDAATGDPDGNGVIAPFDDAGADAGSLPDGCVTGDVFTFDGIGSREQVADGAVTLTLHPGQRAALTHTFDAGQSYGRSTVDLLLDVGWQTAWGNAGPDYAPLLHEYFGADDSAKDAIDIIMAQTVLEAHIQPSTDTIELNGMPVPRSTGVHVVLDTTWSAMGSLTVTTTPGATWTVPKPTADATSTARALTLVIGGTANGNVPDVTVVVHQACVTFAP